jgi:hypothetical protein
MAANSTSFRLSDAAKRRLSALYGPQDYAVLGYKPQPAGNYGVASRAHRS